MRPMSKILIMLLLVGSSAPGLAQEPSYTVLDPKAYQSFVANWTPSNKPLCAAIQSQADWDAVFHPAPVMGANRPFGPPAEFWNDRAVLVLARVIDSGDTAKVFQLTGVHRDENVVEVDYSFRLTPPASSQIKWWLGVAAAKPLPPTVRFKEDGRLVCAVEPGTRTWLRPPPAKE